MFSLISNYLLQAKSISKSTELLEKLVNVVTEETINNNQNNNNHANNDIDSLFAMIRPFLERLNPVDRFTVNLDNMKVVQDAKMQYLTE